MGPTDTGDRNTGDRNTDDRDTGDRKVTTLADERHDPDRPDGTPGGDAPPASAGPRRRSGRGVLWLAGLLVLALGLVLGARAVDIWPKINPFAEEQTDRSQPPLLLSIQDLSRFVAAEGTFQVVIDLQRNRKYVPDFLLKERTLLVGAGRVDAYVDFSTLTEGAVTASADRTAATIRVPAPKLGEAALDLEASYVFAEERGLINRVGDVFGGDPNRQRDAYRLAEERIGAAARDSGLLVRAEENTRKMLTGLLHSLGYKQVTIEFAPAA